MIHDLRVSLTSLCRRAVPLIAPSSWLCAGAGGGGGRTGERRTHLRLYQADRYGAACGGLRAGYFEDEGLYVTLQAQANWKVLLDGVIDGQLDGAHMLAGQPLAATIGFGTRAHIVTPFSMDLNGNGITLSTEVWEQMKPQHAEDARRQAGASHQGGLPETGNR